MLREIVEKKHYLFADKAADWRDAIRMSCRSLVADGTCSENYAEQMVAAIEKFGPYIIIAPMVAMPHVQDQDLSSVFDTSIGFMRLEEPVSFDPEDPSKDARLFFTLASCNPEKHLGNMSRLAELLMTDGVVDALMEADSPEALLKVQEEYLG